MSQYCDYRDWEDFCEKNKPFGTEHKYSGENNLFERAETISRNTFQALSNRSGVPYYYTIDRKTLNDHLSIFDEEDYTATVFIGPTGSGKTIGLLRWLEKKMAPNPTQRNSNVYIFFSGHHLNSAMLYENSLEKWLLNMYGIQTNYGLAEYFTEHHLRLYLIIDGFDEYLFKVGQFETVFNQLIDIVTLYKDSRWFKLIITMSSATWTNNMSRINNFHMIQHKWYFGNMHTSDHTEYNVVPFSYDELFLLSKNISPDGPVPPKLEESTLHFLGHAEYFTYFYHANRQNFSLYNAKPAHLYSILTTYILDNIYSGRMRAEKVALIDAIIGHMNWQKHIAYISRSLVQPTVRLYAQAYRELISNSILSETNRSSTFRYKDLIYFGNNHLARYFLTEKILKDNDYEITHQLIHDAQYVTVGHDDYLGILKWLIFHAVNRREFKVLSFISKLKLHPAEKAVLATFICDYLHQNFDELNSDTSFNTFLEKDFIFFNSFFTIPLVSNDYAKSIAALLRFSLPADKVILIRTLLSFAALLEADLNSAENQLQEIRRLPKSAFDHLPVNPADALMALIAFLKQGKIIKPVFVQVTSLLFNPDKLTKRGETFETYFRIAGYAMQLTHNYRKTYRFIKLLRKALPVINGSISMEFNLWLSILECRTALLGHHTQSADLLYKYISNRYGHQYDNFTELMRITYLLLKIKAVILLKKQDDLTAVAKQISQMANSSGFVIFDILRKAYMLNLSPETILTEAEIRSLKSSLKTLKDAKGINLENFGGFYTPTQHPDDKFKSQA